MLSLCSQFFDFLNQENIRYCHWKSNEHLDKALDGKTDLDLLVHPDDKPAFQAALEQFDFKLILSPKDKQFPGLEDYLGFDDETGAFVHLHLHYQLILGQKYIKNHHLPLEKLFFRNLVDRQGVHIPCAELELILLIIRAHLKVDVLSLAKHQVKDLLRQPYTAFPRDIEDELVALHGLADPSRFEALLVESGLPLSHDQCLTFLQRLSNGKLRAYQIWSGYRLILEQLYPYQRTTGLAVKLSYFRHFIKNSAVVRRFRDPGRKTLVGRGRFFALVGADGSGKSTLIKDLNGWLSWKMAVDEFYFGIPKNLVGRATSLTTRILHKVGLKRAESFILDLYWLYVARYRSSVSDRIAESLKQGTIVISDRFPMSEFRAMKEPMDNPRIGESRRLFGKKLRHIEEAHYARIQSPDRIFVLQVELEELRRRKSDLGVEQHTTKALAVNSVSPSQSVCPVDANRPYDAVLLSLKRRIWQAI